MLKRKRSTFLSHRQVGITARFAWSNHLLDEGALEIWRLREQKVSKELKKKKLQTSWGYMGTFCSFFLSKEVFERKIPQEP